uniref:Uncharacterized protein n=1 Tax=Solibacter usitatus (strain Ellin6076) TaxID=234267 RepID=Q01WY5_SOLUE
MTCRAIYRIPIWTLAAVSCVTLPCMSAAPTDPVAGSLDNSPLARGQRVARAVATVTGTAISPLFGVCVLGAYTYAITPQPHRAALPFYCAPIFWIPLAILVTLVMLKDTVGSAAPLLKKPLDAIEILVVNKAAFLFAVLPVVWHEAAAISGWRLPGGLLPESFMAFLPTVHAAAPGAVMAGDRAIPIALTAVAGAGIAFAVWLTGHALDVLALLSPVPLLDIFFKASRAAIFLTVGAFAVFNSRVALVVSLVIIAICLLCFWWAFRLAVFGAVFAWDILRTCLLGRRRDPSLDGEVLGFTAYAIGGLSKRSFGALRIAADGSLEFAHRPVGLGFRSTVRLQRPDKYEVGKGFIFPCLLAPGKAGKNYRFQFRLLPRYAGYEEEIRDMLRLRGVRDLRVPSEFQSAWNWLRGTVARPRAT